MAAGKEGHQARYAVEAENERSGIPSVLLPSCLPLVEGFACFPHQFSPSFVEGEGHTPPLWDLRTDSLC